MKLHNFILWAAIKHIIDDKRLRILVFKVKAHTKNERNNRADELAKIGMTKDPILFDTSFIHPKKSVFEWSHQILDVPLHPFFKELQRAEHFNSFLNLNRNKKVKLLTTTE
jgi:hypothetical protein